MRFLPSPRLKPGSLLIITIVFAAVILFGAVTIFDNIANFSRFSSNQTRTEQAVQLTEAGIDYALFKINDQEDYFWSDDRNGFEAVTDIGSGDIHVREEYISDTRKRITVTGFIPKFGAFEQKVTAQVEVEAQLEGISMPFPLVAHIENDLDLEGTHNEFDSELDGDVYAGGYFKEGSPPDGGNITSSSCDTNIVLDRICRITGNASAFGSISSDIIVEGITTDSAPPLYLPTLDYAYWEAEAIAGGIVDNIQIENGNITSVGPAVIDSDLTLGGNLELTVTGTLYIEGSLTVQDDAKLILADSFGSNGTVIIAEGGSSKIHENGQVLANSASPKGYLLLTDIDSRDPGDPYEGGKLSYFSDKPSQAIFYVKGSKANTSLFERSFSGSTFPDDYIFTGAIAMWNVVINGFKIQYDPDLANMKLLPSPTGGTGISSTWQIVRGTYIFNSEEVTE